MKIAEAVAANLAEAEELDSVKVVAPGFINFHLAKGLAGPPGGRHHRPREHVRQPPRWKGASGSKWNSCRPTPLAPFM